MNFKFLLFRKEFLFGFIFCMIAGICVVGYSMWYGVSLNVNENGIIRAGTRPAPTG